MDEGRKNTEKYVRYWRPIEGCVADKIPTMGMFILQLFKGFDLLLVCGGICSRLLIRFCYTFETNIYFVLPPHPLDPPFPFFPEKKNHWFTVQILAACALI